jgi:Golgi phosphoprotein 3 (GPP34)
VIGNGGMGGNEMMARLAGTGRLADDLYLMAHDENTGRPQLQPRALGMGLAGALLAELMLAGRADLNETVVFIADRTPPADRLLHYIHDQILSEGEQHPARDWLHFLARTSAEDVARRLGEAGYLNLFQSRMPWRGDRWVPVDPDCAFAPFTRVRATLDRTQPLTVPGATLTGLATACGLTPRLLNYAPANARRPEDAVEQLWPGLRELITQVRITVDSAVLAHRA